MHFITDFFVSYTQNTIRIAAVVILKDNRRVLTSFVSFMEETPGVFLSFFYFGALLFFVVLVAVVCGVRTNLPVYNFVLALKAYERHHMHFRLI